MGSDDVLLSGFYLVLIVLFFHEMEYSGSGARALDWI